MDILCAQHAKDSKTCQWVIDNYDKDTDNITVRLWVEACKNYLKSLDNDK